MCVNTSSWMQYPAKRQVEFDTWDDAMQFINYLIQAISKVTLMKSSNKWWVSWEETSNYTYTTSYPYAQYSGILPVKPNAT